MMYKFLVALFLLYVPASMSALAHSGTDQEEKACTRDVQRFCRNLMDQGGFYHSGLPQGESPETFDRVPPGAGQPRAIAADRQMNGRSLRDLDTDDPYRRNCRNLRVRTESPTPPEFAA